MIRRVASHAATALLVACAVLVTAAVVRREFFAPAAAAAGPSLEPRRVAEGAALAAAGQVMGRAGAPVRVVEFSDFQCPYCAEFARTLRAVRDRHPDVVSIVYRHLPLDAIHPHARAAALAAECAGEQDRFEAFHDALFAGQPGIGIRPWESFAREAGVPDTAAFTRCIQDGRLLARVDRDAAAARAAGMEVTPTLVVGDTLRPGVMDEAELERWILRAAARR